jgi:hypothetical protein
MLLGIRLQPLHIENADAAVIDGKQASILKLVQRLVRMLPRDTGELRNVFL